MKLEIELPDGFEPRPASAVGKAFSEFLSVCQSENMTLERIADFLVLSAEALRLGSEGDPLKAVVRDAAKVAVVAQSGILDGVFDDDIGVEEDDEIDRFIEELGPLPVIERLEAVNARFDQAAGRAEALDPKELKEILGFVDGAVDAVTGAWEAKGRKWAVFEDEWRHAAGKEKLEDEESYLFLDDLGMLMMDDLAMAVLQAVVLSCVNDNRADFDLIAEAIGSSRYAMLAMAMHAGGINAAMADAKRAFSRRGEFMSEIENGIKDGGIPKSRFLDGYAEIRNFAEEWLDGLVEAGQVAIVKKGNRLTIVKPFG